MLRETNIPTKCPHKGLSIGLVLVGAAFWFGAPYNENPTFDTTMRTPLSQQLVRAQRRSPDLAVNSMLEMTSQERLAALKRVQAREASVIRAQIAQYYAAAIVRIVAASCWLTACICVIRMPVKARTRREATRLVAWPKRAAAPTSLAA